jgi:hypothetical protein
MLRDKAAIPRQQRWHPMHGTASRFPIVRRSAIIAISLTAACAALPSTALGPRSEEAAMKSISLQDAVAMIPAEATGFMGVGRSKIVRECSLSLTSDRPVDLVVIELAVIGFPDGRATLLETAEGITVEQAIAATDAELAIFRELAETSDAGSTPESVSASSMGETV